MERTERDTPERFLHEILIMGELMQTCGAEVFRVEDTGSGIDSAQLPHIFEKGYSGDGGSGLGLSICREAVESHGGRLEVESTGPEGTVFAFTVLKREAQT